MNYEYRLKTYQDEEGEYSEYQPCTKETILNIIQQHWMGESMPNGLEIISITDGIGEHLLLEHQHKYVFEIYYLPIEEQYHYHKKSTIDAVLDSLELFMTGNTVQLQGLNKTKKENSYIRGRFFYADHNYRYTEKRNWQALSWLITGLPVGLMCIAICFFMLVAPVPGPIWLSLSFSAFFGIFFFYSLLLGLLIHRQYLNDIDDWIIRITRGQDKITATLYGNTKEWSKKDILRVTRYENPMYRIPWSEYGYTTIEFKSGEIINLTNLIVNQIYVLEKFRGEQIEINTVNSRVPFLKKRMHII